MFVQIFQGKRSEASKFIANRIFRNLSRDCSIDRDKIVLLEIGTGVGHFANVCSNRDNIQYIGIEPALALVEQAKMANPLGRFFSDSLPNLENIHSESADIVVLIHVIEHAESAYQARLWLTEIQRVLRPGGRVLIISPELLDFKNYFWDIDWSHCYPTTLRNLSQLVADLDFQVINGRYFVLAGTSFLHVVLGKIFSKLFPTSLIDLISNVFIKRRLGTGFQVALLWRSIYLVLKK
jgi:SAM-dependent methyltransferase